MTVLDPHEIPTGEVARLCGVTPDLLRKWKARGELKLAPHSVAGAGRGNEAHWTPEAVEEARQRAARTASHGKRARSSESKQ